MTTPFQNRVLILGPSLSAVSGVSTHLNQLLGSDLSKQYVLEHFQIGSEGQKETFLHKMCRFLISPLLLGYKIIKLDSRLVHLNPPMNMKGFFRDSVYLLIAKTLGRKVIYQIHGGYLPMDFCKNHILMKTLLKSVLRLSDSVVVLTSSESRAYEDFDPDVPVRTISNAINLAPYIGCKQKNFKQSHLNLLYIGRLIDTKGISETINAIHLLKNEPFYNRCHFYIAGSGPAETLLKKKASMLGLSEKVSFLGPVFGADKIKLWEAAHCFVFPTYFPEGQPYAILESIASGTPVITTRIGGIPDVIRENVHGIFVEPRNPYALSSGLSSLLGNNEKLQYMSSQCFLTAKDYAIDKLVRQFSALYREVLS